MEALLADRRLERPAGLGAVRAAVFEDSGEIRERVTSLHTTMIASSTP
jgi:hypothetical protein